MSSWFSEETNVRSLWPTKGERIVARRSRETHDAQDAPEQGRREARSPQTPIQGEEVDGPQDKDQLVIAVGVLLVLT